MTIPHAEAFGAAALLLGLAVGICVGWVGRGRPSPEQTAQISSDVEDKVADPYGADPAGVSCLWDAHSCLNALSRCIMNTPVSLAEDHLLYLVSDHLRLLAQLGPSGGWVSPERLQEWLRALVALQPDAPVDGVKCHVSLPVNTVQQLRIQPLGMALLPLLRQARPVVEVSIEADEMRLADGVEQTASLVLRLRLRVSEGRKLHAPHGDEGTQAPREWNAQVACECIAIH